MAWYANPESSQVDPRHGDVPTVAVSALVPIIATSAERPLRALARLLLIVGILMGVLSIAGSVAWVAVVGSSVDFAKDDIATSLSKKDDVAYFDLDKEASNVKTMLSLAGAGVGAVGFALGIVIVVIGGVARQLDRTLAPLGGAEADGKAMAAVAYPGIG